MQIPLLYRPKSVFGLDIGRSTVKLVQVKSARGQIRVVGYGYAKFDPTATQDGVILKPDLVGASIRELFGKSIIGKISSNRVMASIPIAHIYTRILSLPSMAEADLAEAVQLEVEQYIPIPAKELYIEHRSLPTPVVASGKAPAEVNHRVLMVAAPRKIVSSYVQLFDQLGLEVAAIEPNMFSNIRSINYNCPPKGARVLIDFGARSSDLAIYNQSIQLVSTVATGGDHITERIASTLKLSNQQASELKVHYGIAKSRWQVQLATALQPILSDFANEVQKLTRYYHEHSGNQASIEQIVLVGGGANMPGLSDFLSHLTGIEVVICNPWGKLAIDPLRPPAASETTVYATSVGLALKELEGDD